MPIPLIEAVAATCGGKAAALGAMLRAGLPVPDGFVVPMRVYSQAGDSTPVVAAAEGLDAGHKAIPPRRLPGSARDAVDRALRQLGDCPVAVRSSAANEDTGQASAAGQYDSFLAVRGTDDVADAIEACWASLHSARAIAYRTRFDANTVAMAVIVQRHLDADVSGVMFTPTGGDGPTVIESAWGLGPSVATGTVAPDTYRVDADGTITRTIADKRTRLDRIGRRLVTQRVAPAQRARTTLDDAAARDLAALGEEVAAVFGGRQDVEWAIAERRVWLLQARPITTPLPPPADPTRPSPGRLAGTPGSRGTATGTARVVRGPQDFPRVRHGDVLICRFTDPAWTPLLHMAAGVVTETGGALSHAAIVARERGIPAVLGVVEALDSIPDGVTITIDGTTGTISNLA